MLALEKELRSKGWSYAETARRSGLNQVTIGQIVSGRFVPYPSQLLKLAKALGWPEERAEGLLDEVSRDDG